MSIPIALPQSNFTEEIVLSVHHWTDDLFSFTTTRPSTLRFSNGHFTMVGLMLDGKPLMRAYSIASANHEEHLEFLSIKVEGGPLTSRLRLISRGDKVLVGRKPTGTLLIDHLLPGRNLHLLGTGTGLAPFMAIIQDPETYSKFEHAVLAHGVRKADEFAYREMIQTLLPSHEFLGESITKQLRYYPSATREAFATMGRLTDALASGKMQAELRLPPLDPALDRAMICGGPAMIADMRAILIQKGFSEGSASKPGSFVVERAFVEK